MDHRLASDTDAPQPYGERFPVLYVDDEEENLIVFRATFGAEFHVLEARSAAEALEQLNQHFIAVLLTDHRMPHMTGIELCERARELSPRTRRMLMTAYSDHQTAIEAINRGRVHAYLSKPWDAQEVRHTLIEGIQRVELEQTVDKLREEMDAKNRLLALAKMRDRLLHDVAGATTRLTISTRSLKSLFSKRRSDLPLDFAKKGERDIGLLDSAVEYLVNLQAQRHTAVGDQLHVRPVPLAEILNTLRTLVGPAREGIRVTLPEAPDVLVSCERVSVIRILTNLVKNAREAMVHAGFHGEITLRVEQVNDEVVFDVVDQGPGVPPALREKIFDELFSTKKDSGGSGIGLAASRALAEANHGSLELPEPQPARGALFRLTIPAAASDRTSPRPAAESDEPSVASGRA